MNHTTHTLALLLLAVSSAEAAAPAPERLGTLFYSPTERAAIVAAREGKSEQETPSGLTVSGILKREGGKGTVWINRRAIPEGQTVPPAAAPAITTQGVTIDGKPVRVGETVNLVTGERTDVLPPGSVSAGRKK